jgi:hypothetical protein
MYAGFGVGMDDAFLRWVVGLATMKLRFDAMAPGRADCAVFSVCRAARGVSACCIRVSRGLSGHAICGARTSASAGGLFSVIFDERSSVMA